MENRADTGGASRTTNEPPARTESAVIVPVFRDPEGELRVVLVLRGARGIHGGQLGLPGGKMESDDDSLLDTALREAEEEIGLTRSEVEILAQLDPVDTRTTGFRVHPYLARIAPPTEWRVAAGEISDVVTPRVRKLADPSGRHEQRLSFPHWSGPRVVECVRIDGGQLLWGLTLRLLDPLLPRLLAGDWPI